jgi:uncharacterized membrane protein YkoI
MEQEVQQKRGFLKYGLPALGIALPVAGMIWRRAASMREEMMEEEEEGDSSRDQALLMASNIDINAAMGKALKLVPGTPIEVELEEEHGIPVWEVEVVPAKGGPTREVLIDARSGDVLEIKADFESAVC